MIDYSIKNALHFFNDSPDKFWREVQEMGVIQQFFHYQFVAMEGDDVGYFPIVISGSLRVYRNDVSGREITLYRLEPGEGCVLSAYAILSRSRFNATAEVEENTTLLLIPDQVFRDWLDRFECWRNYVFTLVFKQFNALVSKMQSLAFDRVDERLAHYIAQRVQQRNVKILRITHQQIARELGTAREVVSRILKDFERSNWVKLERGRIVVLDSFALQQYNQKEMPFAI